MQQAVRVQIVPVARRRTLSVGGGTPATALTLNGVALTLNGVTLTIGS